MKGQGFYNPSGVNAPSMTIRNPMINSISPNVNIPIDPQRQSIMYSKDSLLKEEETTIYEMQKEEELRIEIGKGDTVRILVESGYAEIEGAELPLNYVISFTYNKFAIFCWTETKIKVEGKPQSIYRSDSNRNTMTQYLMVHYLINEMRNEALVNNRIGPRILITGSSSSGKTTLCHVLLNYALKQGWTPIYVDLDTSNEIAVPGSIAATPVDFVVPNDFMIDSAITLFSGNSSNELNLFLYEKQVNEISNLVNSKLQFDLDFYLKKLSLVKDKTNDTGEDYSFSPKPNNMEDEDFFVNNEHPTIFASGVIVHCPIISASTDFSIYQKLISDFNLDMILVIEDEKLYNAIKNITEKNSSSRKTNLSVCLLQKLLGINSEQTYKEFLEHKRFDSYFKGPFNNLKITELKIDLNYYKILQIISSNVTSALLPIGSISDLNILLKEVNSEENLLNRIVAIVHIEEKIVNELDASYDTNLNSYVDTFARAPVSFLAYITKYDKFNKTIYVYSPCAELKHKYLLVGNMKFRNI